MMTIKQARKFREQLQQGESPSLPRSIAKSALYFLAMNPLQIICHATNNSSTNAIVCRLIQMGLLDYRCHLTNYGEVIEK